MEVTFVAFIRQEDDCWTHSLPLIQRDWEGATTDKSEDLPLHYESITCWNMGRDYANLLLKFFVADRVCNGFIVPVVVTLQIVMQ